jgi:micrococcal nuclease
MAEVTYKNCRIERVVDGDTVDVIVDLGFFVSTKTRIRLAYINAPEVGDAAGVEAKNTLAALCLGAEVVLTCHGRDRYGRWIGTLERKTDHLNLNDEMIRLGCAVAVKY